MFVSFYFYFYAVYYLIVDDIVRDDSNHYFILHKIRTVISTNFRQTIGSIVGVLHRARKRTTTHSNIIKIEKKEGLRQE